MVSLEIRKQNVRVKRPLEISIDTEMCRIEVMQHESHVFGKALNAGNSCSVKVRAVKLDLSTCSKID